MKCIQDIGMLFMNLCSCAYLHIFLRLFQVCSYFFQGYSKFVCEFIFLMSWIICIEFVMSLNIHQVFGVPLEQLLIYLFCFIFLCNFFFI